MKEAPKSTAAAVNRLTDVLTRLPGIGPKSAQRLAYHLLKASDEQVKDLADALVAVKQKTQRCRICCNITDAEICSICSSPVRDQSRICVVEQPQDMLTLEHTNVYKGVYHVLHGAISPSEGVGSGDIRLAELMTRLESGAVAEIILATNANVEGETTAMYLQRLIAPLGVKVTRLARGLPFGGEIEYADDVTLSRAMENRQEF
ncbi:recombination mediator RecR [Dehalogenimonas etheniformans]|uniref:Recombination protein RecR n=1 Tax=Dehalogenimonas etheniformans TaxID=1536648 RepID=A0A2P5P5Z6_9CHLR|nr:recombination mediator RecR [Dehalogenimonas etheniformans]PPD57707.1 recombination protein RecR [Dehalogenimonas etheniformans]QNT76047.1 recombination protein RecR [Dehalogenimonas etheniformans]